MSTKLLTYWLLVTAAMWLGAGSMTLADDLDELKQRFKQRYPQLEAAKKEGKIGETHKGLVEAVEKQYAEDPQIASLIKEENADRMKLYAIIAEQTGVSPADVARRNAERNFEKAKPGEYLKDSSGKWRQKQ